MLAGRPDPFLIENLDNIDEDDRVFSSITLSNLDPVKPLGSCTVLLSRNAAGKIPDLPLLLEPDQHQ